MYTLRKFKLKINLKKAECLYNNNFLNAGFLRSIQRQFENIDEYDYISIFNILNLHKHNLKYYYNTDFLDFLNHFENEFKKDERYKKLEKLSSIL